MLFLVALWVWFNLTTAATVAATDASSSSASPPLTIEASLRGSNNERDRSPSLDIAEGTVVSPLLLEKTRNDWDPTQHPLYGQTVVVSESSIQGYDKDNDKDNNYNNNMSQRLRSTVVNGQDASPDDAPYYVAMLQRVGQGYTYRGCGGSLLSPRHIMTAAHCIQGRDGLLKAGLEYVLIHAYRPFDLDGLNGGVSGHLSKSASYTVHSMYVEHNLKNDVGIITLDTPVPLAEMSNFEPVQLAEQEFGDGTPATLHGLGRLRKYNYDQVQVLQTVDLEIISSKTCRKYHGAAVDQDCMICAGYDTGWYDSCFGDSGSPLVTTTTTTNNNNQLVQVGIVSWGDGCGQMRNPGVYTKVSGVRPWVKDVVCGALDDVTEKPLTPLCTTTTTSSIVAQTASPSLSPTASPTPVPTASPTPVPTASPTPVPTDDPTTSPTASPTFAPTSTPSYSPTGAEATAAASSCVPFSNFCDPNGPSCCGGATCKNLFTFWVCL